MEPALMRQLLIFTHVAFFLFYCCCAEAATNDEQALAKLNIEIASAEDRGDIVWLESILAPELVFRRANGVVVGRQQFLENVSPRSKSKTRIESIILHGRDRAVVTCIVTVKIGGVDSEFHNIRMFIREVGFKKMSVKTA